MNCIVCNELVGLSDIRSHDFAPAIMPGTEEGGYKLTGSYNVWHQHHDVWARCAEEVGRSAGDMEAAHRFDMAELRAWTDCVGGARQLSDVSLGFLEFANDPEARAFMSRKTFRRYVTQRSTGGLSKLVDVNRWLDSRGLAQIQCYDSGTLDTWGRFQPLIPDWVVAFLSPNLTEPKLCFVEDLAGQ